MIIEGAGHQPVKALVTKDGRLATEAIARSRLEVIAQSEADSYYLATNFVALTTTASFSGIFYLKNTVSGKDLHIYRLRTCGEMQAQWKLIRNPSTGTLITGEVPGETGNLNTGSSKVFTHTLYAGVDGATVGEEVTNHMTQWQDNIGHSEQQLDGAIVIPTGSSIALMCKPSVAGDVCVSILAYEHDITALPTV